MFAVYYDLDAILCLWPSFVLSFLVVGVVMVVVVAVVVVFVSVGVVVAVCLCAVVLCCLLFGIVD